MSFEDARQTVLRLGFEAIFDSDLAVDFERERVDNSNVYLEYIYLYMVLPDEPKVGSVRYFTYYSC